MKTIVSFLLIAFLTVAVPTEDVVLHKCPVCVTVGFALKRWLMQHSPSGQSMGWIDWRGTDCETRTVRVVDCRGSCVSITIEKQRRPNKYEYIGNLLECSDELIHASPDLPAGIDFRVFNKDAVYISKRMGHRITYNFTSKSYIDRERVLKPLPRDTISSVEQANYLPLAGPVGVFSIVLLVVFALCHRFVERKGSHDNDVEAKGYDTDDQELNLKIFEKTDNVDDPMFEISKTESPQMKAGSMNKLNIKSADESVKRDDCRKEASDSNNAQKQEGDPAGQKAGDNKDEFFENRKKLMKKGDEKIGTIEMKQNVKNKINSEVQEVKANENSKDDNDIAKEKEIAEQTEKNSEIADVTMNKHNLKEQENGDMKENSLGSKVSQLDMNAWKTGITGEKTGKVTEEGSN